MWSPSCLNFSKVPTHGELTCHETPQRARPCSKTCTNYFIRAHLLIKSASERELSWLARPRCAQLHWIPRYPGNPGQVFFIAHVPTAHMHMCVCTCMYLFFSEHQLLRKQGAPSALFLESDHGSISGLMKLMVHVLKCSVQFLHNLLLIVPGKQPALLLLSVPYLH